MCNSIGYCAAVKRGEPCPKGEPPPVAEFVVPDEEFAAQCWGGPMHGEPVSAKTRVWLYHSTTLMFLDGDEEPAIVRVFGRYIYDEREADHRAPVFMWDGPGADGDTMERLRRR